MSRTTTDPIDPRPVSATGSRPYRVTVATRTDLSPHFVRLVLRGEDLDIFGTGGLDQRIKLVFPNPDGSWLDLGLDDPRALAAGDWYQRWLDAAPESRNPFRTYTVRRIDPRRRELTVDLAVHGAAGPGSRFAQGARPGDELIVVGPDGRSPDSRLGIDFHPGPARHLLLAGDETAAPAVCSILESLADDGPGRWQVHAYLEVPDAEDFLPIGTTDGIQLTWLARTEVLGGALIAAVRRFCREHPEVVSAGSPRSASAPLEDVDVDRELLWEAPERVPGGEFYAWIAGEAAVVRTLRRLLVGELGVDRARVAFMGYWRAGRAEGLT
ncbi:siderophore-interacting protein [Acidipropionibacterium jensenii]|uniref:siderophore-interacting protein n=1 Tax=Acidipropionibacterium jensenii TaxID=1749 RepID=UPI00214B3782|nr:siderophore-interacting protein [Acidipropionibacterium jensenii]